MASFAIAFGAAIVALPCIALTNLPAAEACPTSSLRRPFTSATSCVSALPTSDRTIRSSIRSTEAAHRS